MIAGPSNPQTTSTATIDVWVFALDLPDAASLGSFLSPDEVERASRLLREDDARRFRLAHRRLREILARYLHAGPASIAFGVDAHQKPFVTSPKTSLRFNLSHTDELGAVAVSDGMAVGVDIERVRALDGPDLEPMFSRKEQQELAAYAGAERRQAFFRCWTRKEALLKAWGRGLDVPLDSFDVPVSADPDVIVQVSGDTPEHQSWRLISFAPAAGFVGTIAVPAGAAGTRVALDVKSWPPSA